MKNEIWFPAKRYGWGWGLPVRWQGWVVLTAYVGLLTLTVSLPALRSQPGTCAAGIGGLSGLLILVCWLKGERPKWRWGGKDADS
jgi:hypothetical protein